MQKIAPAKIEIEDSNKTFFNKKQLEAHYDQRLRFVKQVEHWNQNESGEELQVERVETFKKPAKHPADGFEIEYCQTVRVPWWKKLVKNYNPPPTEDQKQPKFKCRNCTFCFWFVEDYQKHMHKTHGWHPKTWHPRAHARRSKTKDMKVVKNVTPTGIKNVFLAETFGDHGNILLVKKTKRNKKHRGKKVQIQKRGAQQQFINTSLIENYYN